MRCIAGREYNHKLSIELDRKIAMTENFDVIVIGGGAAGLMCAISAGQRGRRVLVIEHANRVGKKILVAGAAISLISG
jgi:NADPH-dependent 2,4-dienoyl-CoA reductase/sulfur reductase-like enzyme